MRTTCSFRRALVLAAVVAFLLAIPAGANTTYTYTGQPFDGFYTYSPCPPSPICSLSGSFTVASPLAPNLAPGTISPLSFTFTDGSDVMTESTSTVIGFVIGTDSLGHIDSWGILLQQGDPFAANIEFCTLSVLADCGDSFSPVFDVTGLNNGVPLAEAWNDLSAGSWVGGGLAAVPEPSSWLLLASGLLSLLGIKKR